MAAYATIRFVPDGLCDFEDYIRVLGEPGEIHVPIIARRLHPKLTLPNEVLLGECLIGDCIKKRCAFDTTFLFVYKYATHDTSLPE